MPDIKQHIAAVLVAVSTLAACADGGGGDPLPDILSLGVLPDRSDELLEERYRPLVAHLEDQLGIQVKLVIPADYGALVDMLASGDVDVANLGGYTFVKAAMAGDAVPLVMRDIDARFTSVCIVPAASDARSMSDLIGRRFAFGSQLSTSGHLMPRYFLETNDFTPERLFSSIEYSGSHDATAFAVRDGRVDAGVINTYVLRNLIDNGQLDGATIRRIWETPPYVDYVYAMHSRFGADAKRQLVDAFLSLSMSNVEHRKVLESLDTSGFLPASMTDFAELERIVIDFTNRSTSAGDSST